MAKLTFLDSFGGDWMNHGERRAINQTDFELKASESRLDDVTVQVAQLVKRDRERGAEIELLEALCRSLVSLLVESGAVDEETLSRRVDETLKEFRAASAPAPSANSSDGSPYR